MGESADRWEEKFPLANFMWTLKAAGQIRFGTAAQPTGFISACCLGAFLDFISTARILKPVGLFGETLIGF